ERETDWTPADQAAFLAVKQLTDLAPADVKRAVFHSMRAPYGLTAVHAGQVDAVHDRILETVNRQMLVEVEGQTDIVTIGIPYLGPYNVNAILNPGRSAAWGWANCLTFSGGNRVWRRGGAATRAHPAGTGLTRGRRPTSPA